MLSVYPACFIEEEKGYSVIFPDLNDLATCGDTFEDAMRMAVDCLAGHLFLAEKDGEAVGAPTPLPAVDTAALLKEYEVAPEKLFVTTVSVDADAYAKQHFQCAVKKTLTIPAWLNKLALEQNLNFSKVLQEALKEKLHLNKEV